VHLSASSSSSDYSVKIVQESSIPYRQSVCSLVHRTGESLMTWSAVKACFSSSFFVIPDVQVFGVCCAFEYRIDKQRSEPEVPRKSRGITMSWS